MANVEKTLFGNGQPGLVTSHAKMLGYLKGCAAVGGILLALILIVVSFILTSISTIETEIRQPQVVRQSPDVTRPLLPMDSYAAIK